MRIDAHHHFWHYNPGEYGWISDDMASIRRDFLPPDLHRVIHDAGIDAAVSVHARQSLEDTVWLLDLAEAHPFLRGVVGWAPLASHDIRAVLDHLVTQPKLKGLRHVVQDEPDPDFLDGPEFQYGISLLEEHGLVFDLLVYQHQLPAAIRLVDRFPHQRFVLDHIGKPLLRHGELEPWATHMRVLAERENVWCKVSGIPSEANRAEWTLESIRPYLDTVLEAFGCQRLLFGSDWPVCLVATDYGRWVKTIETWSNAFSREERDALFGATAVEVYNL